jgi:multidrug transporter EmrE-like cation transporter
MENKIPKILINNNIMSTALIWILLALSSFMIAGAQLLIKKGSLILATQETQSDNFILKIINTLFETHIFIALAIYVIGFFIWIKVLSQLELNRAYPVQISLVVLLTTLGAFFFFGESLDTYKIFAIFFIITGIVLLTIH